VEWADDNPFFLLLNALDTNPDGTRDYLVLDVGVPGWQATRAEWLRRPAEWYLCAKSERRVVLAQIVYAGEYPYYVQRHIGQAAGPLRREISVYGIGKRVPAVYRQVPRPNSKKTKSVLVSPERIDRLWVLPHGVVCGGEDVEKMAMAVVSTLEWKNA
jgi:hypothetical protein